MSGAVDPSASIPDGHAARAAEARASEHRARRVSRRYSAARLGLVLAIVLGAVWSFDGAAPPGVGWGAVGGGLAFLALVAAHDRVERRARWHATVAAWHEERAWRVARAWDRLPAPWVPSIDPHHPFAHDLDLFGAASVYELVGPPGTEAGRRVLARWLLEPPAPDLIVDRQQAVRELVGDAAFVERVAAHGRIVNDVSAFDLGIFLDWAERDPWLASRPWVRWAARGLGAATPVLLTAQAAGVLETSLWLVTLVAGLVLSWAVRRPMDGTLGLATGWEPAIRAYVGWLQDVERVAHASPYLRRLHAALGPDMPASRAVARFQRIVTFAELRHTALLHLPIHALTLWDFHVWEALERWQRRHGRQVRVWMETLGKIEAIAGLAMLAADHPDWVDPIVDLESTAFEAEEIGHPLLPPARCVRNDVRVGPPGRVLCVTGSNMSGKSTLLRAIGVNAVLAQAGAPVCAAGLRMPPAAVYTSLRITDSLAEGVSFFMAALAQLKRLVEAADQRPPTGVVPRRVLYLLDEILQGTNSVEREAAVRIVIRHLLGTRAIGAITTHDLALTQTPELREHGDHVHFREWVRETGGRVEMTFDYRLRPGVATSRNALALLRSVGLGE
jgi:hypothetical protein